MTKLTKAQAAEKTVLMTNIIVATAAHRADRAATAHGETFNADLFAAVKAAEAALAAWTAANVAPATGYYTRPVFAAPWVQKRVAEQRAHARDIERRVAIAEAKKF